ncbi:MAG: hypothetical protein IPK64_21250 [bacterium]|nr:hypothetical protein [bacterium]
MTGAKMSCSEWPTLWRHTPQNFGATRRQMLCQKYRNGFYSYGKTAIGDFIHLNRTAFADVSPSLARVMEAVSANEGNSKRSIPWDNAFLSFTGILQWTAGTDTSTGGCQRFERLKQDYAVIFQELFYRYGLDMQLRPGGFF